MQNELVLRLIKDGKIAGYMKIVGGKVYVAASLSGQWYLFANWNIGSTYNRNYMRIRFDAVERGIKVGDEWWFEGDMVEMHKYWTQMCERVSGFLGVLKSDNYRWVIKEMDLEGGCLIYLSGDAYPLYKPERIGNIHEEKHA